MSKDIKPVVLDTKQFKTESVNNGTATVVYEDRKAYTNTTDIPVETLKAVAAHNSDYIKTVTSEASKHAVTMMEKDKSIKDVTINFPFGTSANGGVDVLATREKTYPGMKDSDGNKRPDVTKSTLKVTVTEPHNKAPKSFMKELEATMTKSLL